MTTPTTTTPPIYPGKRFDPTGTIDMSDMLSHWADKNAPSGNLALPAGAVYLCNKGVTFTADDMDLTFEPGAKIVQTDPALDQHNRCILSVYGHRQKIHSPRLHGPFSGAPVYLPSIEGQHGITIATSVDGTVIDGNIVVNHVGGNCIYLNENQWHTPASVTNTLITGTVRMGYAGRQIIAASWCDNFTVKVKGSMGPCARTLFDCEPNSTTTWCRNVTFDGSDGLTVFGQGLDLFSGHDLAADITIKNIMSHVPPIISGRVESAGVPNQKNWHVEGVNGNPQWDWAAGGPIFYFDKVDGLSVTDCKVPQRYGPQTWNRVAPTDDQLKAYYESQECTGVVCSGNDWTLH